MSQIEELKKENRMLKRWYVQMIWTAVAFVVMVAVLAFAILFLLGAQLTIDCPLLTEKHCGISIDL